MPEEISSEIKPKYPEINFILLGFKYPVAFDEKVAKEIITIFKTKAKENLYYFTFEELDHCYSDTPEARKKEKDFKKFYHATSWQKKGHDDYDLLNETKKEISKTLKENLKILVENDIIVSIQTIHFHQNELKDVKKYYLRQIDVDLSDIATENSKNDIVQYVFHRMKQFNYNTNMLPSLNELYQNIEENDALLNKLLNQLILEFKISKIPLLVKDDEDHHEVLMLGKHHYDQVKIFLSKMLFPLIKERFSSIENIITPSLQEHNILLTEDDINITKDKMVYHLCFLIMEATKKGKPITQDDYILANLTVNIWLSIENDPLISLKEYAEIELDNDFLNPLFTNYLKDPSLMKGYLLSIKAFIENLPQIIETKDLIQFFKSKGVQKKFVDDFLTYPPKEIKVIHSLGKSYVVSKSLIIKSIITIVEGKFHKSTELGKLQFDLLAHAFFGLEQSLKDYNQLLFELRATTEDYNHVKKLLLQNSIVYKKLCKKKEAVPDTVNTQQSGGNLAKDYDLPVKKIYMAKDFDHLDEERKIKAIRTLDLVVIDGIDSQRNIHQLFIKKSELTLDDIKFLRAKPTYELIKKRFDI